MKLINIKISVLSLIIASLACPLLYSQTLGELYFPKEKTTEIYNVPHGSKVSEVYGHTALKVTREYKGWLQVNISGWIKKEDLKFEEGILKVESFEKTILPPAVEAGHSSERIQFKIDFKNLSDKTINSWAGLITIKTAAGESLFNARLRNDKVDIKPGQTDRLQLILQESQFEDKNNYQNLKRMKEESLRFGLRVFEFNTKQQ